MKKLLIAVAALLVIIIGAVYFVSSNLDGIVKAAIENYGSQATQTRVSVAKVNIKLRDGVGSISGLSVGNPGDYTDPAIFRLGEISLKLDTSTVTKNPVVIDNISIDSPEVFYEIGMTGKSNLVVLKHNLQESTASSSSSSSSGSGLKLVIRHLLIEGGQANVRIAALGDQKQNVALPRIELTDIGKKSGGVTAVELAQLLSKEMLNNVKSAVTKAGMDKYLGKSADQIKAALKKAGGSAGGVGGQLGGALKGLLGK